MGMELNGDENRIPTDQGQLSLPSLRGWYMSTCFVWEGKGRYGSFR